MAISVRLLAAVGLFLASAPRPTAEAAPPPPARLALEARLFFSASGTFSADVLKPGGPPLVNVVAGQDPSTSSMVTVVVSLASDAVLSSASRVRLIARERPQPRSRARTLVDQTVAVGAIAKGGVAHIGFWLQGTGCRPIDLQASLTVPGHAAPVSTATSIPFACGE